MGIFKRGGREGVPTLTWRARALRRVGPRRAPDAHPGWLEEKASPPPRPAKFKSPSPALGPLLTDESPSSWDTPPHLSHSPHGCPQALAPLPPAGAAPCPARCREAAGRPLPPALGTSPRSLAIPLRPSAARPAQAHPAVPGASSRPSPSRPSWPGPPAARPPPPRRPFRPAPPRRSAPLPPGFLRRGCPPTWAWVSTSRAPSRQGRGSACLTSAACRAWASQVRGARAQRPGNWAGRLERDSRGSGHRIEKSLSLRTAHGRCGKGAYDP